MYRMMEPDFCHEDERGKLVQLVHDGWRQVNVISSKKGTVRGGHYHRRNKEAFYVISGSFEVALTRDDREETVQFGPGELFVIEPGTVHTFRYLEETILIGLYDFGVGSTGGYRRPRNWTSSGRRSSRGNRCSLLRKAGAPC